MLPSNFLFSETQFTLKLPQMCALLGKRVETRGENSDIAHGGEQLDADMAECDGRATAQLSLKLVSQSAFASSDLCETSCRYI